MNKENFQELCKQHGFNADQIDQFKLAMDHGLNISILTNLGSECSSECMHEIVLGMLHNVDACIYANNMLDCKSMRYLRLGLEADYHMQPYADSSFSAEQLEWIYNGMVDNVPVEKYADSNYSPEKMYRCYHALVQYPEIFATDDFDFSRYNELQLYQLTEACKRKLVLEPLMLEDYNDMQMHELIQGMSSGVDFDRYASTSFNASQMTQLRIGLENGVPIDIYSDSEFTAFQMKQIRLGLEQGLDVTVYANKEFSGKVMLLIRLGQLEGIEVSEYAVPGISESDAQAIYDKLIALQTSIVGESNGDFEVGDAYLDLIGWNTSNEQTIGLSKEFTAKNRSIGIANPESGITPNKNTKTEHDIGAEAVEESVVPATKNELSVDISDDVAPISADNFSFKYMNSPQIPDEGDSAQADMKADDKMTAPEKLPS